MGLASVNPEIPKREKITGIAFSNHVTVQHKAEIKYNL